MTPRGIRAQALLIEEHAGDRRVAMQHGQEQIEPVLAGPREEPTLRLAITGDFERRRRMFGDQLPGPVRVPPIEGSLRHSRQFRESFVFKGSRFSVLNREGRLIGESNGQILQAGRLVDAREADAEFDLHRSGPGKPRASKALRPAEAD